MNESKAPFITLGQHLKYVREQSNESLLEASGAVEIDQKSLERIESGLERPSEDILLLLISHFGVADREALQLWELAQYDGEVPEQIRPESIDLDLNNKPVVMVVGLDARTMYSDGLDVIWNQAGVTLNFTQMNTPTSNSTVARVGMSYEQAQKVLDTLQQAMMRARYLPPNKLLGTSDSADNPQKG